MPRRPRSPSPCTQKGHTAAATCPPRPACGERVAERSGGGVRGRPPSRHEKSCPSSPCRDLLPARGEKGPRRAVCVLPPPVRREDTPQQHSSPLAPSAGGGPPSEAEAG